MILEVGKSYRTRCGKKVTIMEKGIGRTNCSFKAYIYNGLGVGHYSSDGKYNDLGYENAFDLMEEWIEPKIIENYFNVYSDGLGCKHISIPHADRAKIPSSLFQIKVLVNTTDKTASVEVL